MARKMKLTHEDKEKIILFSSENGIWPEFKSANIVAYRSIKTMDREEVLSILKLLEPNADHFFKDSPLRTTIVSNYTAKCHDRLMVIDEVKQIKEKRSRPDLSNYIVLRLLPDPGAEKYLELALKAYWAVYNYFFDKAYEVNSISSTTKKYFNFYEAARELTTLKQNPQYQFLNEVDSLILQKALRSVEGQWKYFWEECKIINETNRKKQVPLPTKRSEQTSFSTMRINGKNNVSYVNNLLKIPKCPRIYSKVHTDKLLPDSELKNVSIEKKYDEWYATLLFRQPQ